MRNRKMVDLDWRESGKELGVGEEELQSGYIM